MNFLLLFCIQFIAAIPLPGILDLFVSKQLRKGVTVLVARKFIVAGTIGGLTVGAVVAGSAIGTIVHLNGKVKAEKLKGLLALSEAKLRAATGQVNKVGVQPVTSPKVDPSTPTIVSN